MIDHVRWDLGNILPIGVMAGLYFASKRGWLGRLESLINQYFSWTRASDVEPKLPEVRGEGGFGSLLSSIGE